MIEGLDPKIVTMGMSCVGKTTWAQSLKSSGYSYHSFDHQYAYNLAGLPEISRVKNWRKIARNCCGDRWVLDNWTTEDHLGKVLFEEHPDCCLCVLFDSRKNILSRYRVPVSGPDAFEMMYDKMYRYMEFERYPKARYIHSDGSSHREVCLKEFREFVESRGNADIGMEFDQSTWTWKNV